MRCDAMESVGMHIHTEGVRQAGSRAYRLKDAFAAISHLCLPRGSCR